FLPWPNFKGRNDTQFTAPSPDAYNYAASITQGWYFRGNAARKLIARNVHQVLGPDIKNEDDWSKFVICWTTEAKAVGGTGHAIRLAGRLIIPIYNLATPKDLDRFMEDFWV